LKITNKKHKKANKTAAYLSIYLNVVKIQHIEKINGITTFFNFLSTFTVLIYQHSYEYINKKRSKL
tara:strand:- start:308 stop:505 length:198 start_codon:yes stop_codon:yes gene_type:complete